MAVVYRLACAACQQGPALPGVGWPNDFGGTSIAEGVLELTTRDGRRVPLSHPLETRILEEHGFSWKSASSEHRLHRVTPHICHGCGQLSLDRQPHQPADGCLVVIIAPVVVLSVATLSGLSGLISFALLVATLGVLSAFFHLRDRRRRRRTPPHTCPTCGDRTTAVRDLGKTTVRCASCGAIAVECEIDAIS